MVGAYSFQHILSKLLNQLPLFTFEVGAVIRHYASFIRAILSGCYTGVMKLKNYQPILTV
jgi:hypothetical protein